MPAIRVQNLSKEYVIGGRPRAHETFREMLADAFLSPYRRYRRLGGDASREERFFALKDVSFEIAPGEVVGIIGRNGAGKSTLLKVLSGITEPTAGRVELTGRTSSLLEVGTGFHQDLTGRENIFLNGALLGMSQAEIREKFDDIVAFSEVEKFLDTPVKHYSSGMYVRLAFAVAAHLEPEILIVDEVLSVGDAKFQQKCLGKMEDAARSGRTVLLVSHNMTAVRSLCSRAIWLDSGSIVMDGDAGAVSAAYLESNAKIALEQIWENPDTAPGNDRIRIHRVSIGPDGEGSTGGLSVATPLRLAFEFWNRAPSAQLNLSMVLYDIHNVCIFNSFSEPRPYPEGLVRGICHIPGNLLNDAKYRVRLLIVEDTSVPLVDLDSLAFFEIRETERPGKWYGKWVGVIRPRLEWETECLSPIGK
jgi:lipopolysaccharide transport system ATP-binding protein